MSGAGAIFVGVVGLVKEIFAPAMKTIDELHTSEEERLLIKAKVEKIQADVTTKLVEYGSKVVELQSKLVEAQSKVLTADASGQSWLQRNWRPMIMLEFGFLLFWNHFLAEVVGVTPSSMPAEMMRLLEIGLGGYIGVRSLEKVVPAIAGLIVNRKK